MFTFSSLFISVTLVCFCRYKLCFDSKFSGRLYFAPRNNIFECATLTTDISSNITDINIALSWSRPPGSVPFKPASVSSSSDMLHAMLLIVAGDIQLNPDPSVPRNTTSAHSSLKFAVLSIRSAVNKTASLHNLNTDFDLDIYALTETWIICDLIPAIMNDVTPAGYRVLYIHCALVPKGSIHGGCLAIIHRNTVPVRIHPFASMSPPSTHERHIVLIVRLGTSSAVTVVDIYCLPSGSIPQFLIALGDFLATLISNTTDRLILCGDFNCPGDDGTCVNDGLQGVLESFKLVFHINEPTRAGILLDIIVSDDPGLVSKPTWMMLAWFPIIGYSTTNYS